MFGNEFAWWWLHFFCIFFALFLLLAIFHFYSIIWSNKFFLAFCVFIVLAFNNLLFFILWQMVERREHIVESDWLWISSIHNHVIVMLQYYGILLILKTAAYNSFSSDFYTTKLVLYKLRSPQPLLRTTQKEERSNW
jgi:hypothetical protein